MESTKSSQEVLVKTTSYTKKSLEPIKEESLGSSTDLRSRSKRSSTRQNSTTSPPIRFSKPCPATQGECPTKKAMAEKRYRSTNYSYRSSLSRSSDTFNTKKSYSSILEKPFIFRNAASLQKAVEQNDKKMMELYLKQAATGPDSEEAPTLVTPLSMATTSSATETERYSDSKSQTEGSESIASYASTEKRKLEYLMGIPTERGEDEGDLKKDIDQVLVDEKLEKSLTGETEAMRQAQRYLRVHRIFEFYQFLVAHLLSALPENPINFLLDLMDKCIVYRAGMGNPPVLYDKKHLDALFNLMDRMRTGYIDKDQYVTGMKTLGICSYNPNPPTTENMISKNFFIEEAYENLVSMLNDIIRRRWIYFTNQPLLPIKTPPPTPQFSTRSGRTNRTNLSTK